MDYEVLRPKLVWVNNSCYRKTSQTNSSSNAYFGGDTIDEYAEEKLDNLCKEEEYDLNEKNESARNYIIEYVNGRYQTSIQIASAFYGYIIGKGGASMKRIEYETNTTIILPRRGVENEDIQIKGDSKSGVANACSRIFLIVESSRSKMDQTHFISIPLNSREMQEAHIKFKQDVLAINERNNGERSKMTISLPIINETLFQSPSLLHLTIGTLSLMDNRERQQACELLEDCKESIIIPLIGTSGLEVEISGLEIMNDDPAEVDVIYAKVKPVITTGGDAEILQKMADRIVDKFVASGLMRRQYDRVKLHLTVMNTAFPKASQEKVETRVENGVIDDNKDFSTMTRERIDARDILTKFGNRHFDKTYIKEMHLSQLKTGRRIEDKYYSASTIIHFSSCG